MSHKSSGLFGQPGSLSETPRKTSFALQRLSQKFARRLRKGSRERHLEVILVHPDNTVLRLVTILFRLLSAPQEFARVQLRFLLAFCSNNGRRNREI